MKLQYTCGCSKNKGVKYHWHRLLEEAVEWFEKPSLDEFCDVTMQITLILNAVFPWWTWIIPPAHLSQLKGMRRFAEHGCCRSYRNRCTK